nr:LEAF RUST 10 DISEASE-RESISTANCE LOCUS RECEPTOR-LIKE PROTEIN KINASE-like 2.1 isoform X2 [Ziziphus jujuba var. spinosa]
MEILFLLKISVIIFCTLLLLLPVSAESRYGACKPRNCGSGPNISYPFYIEDTGLDFCGLRGFKIECSEGKPVYLTSRGPYFVEDISYENQSLRLVDVEVVDATCYAPSHYFAFDGGPMYFSSTHANLQFFYGCNESFSLSFEKKLIPCKSNATYVSYVALVVKDKELSYGEGCERQVGVPIDLEGGFSNQTIKTVDYPQLLKKGFTLRWYGDGCSNSCKTSGGQCGFEDERTVCFCPEGTHSTNCTEGKTGNMTILKVGTGNGNKIFKATIATTVAAGGALTVILICCIRKFKYNKPLCFWKKQNQTDQNIEAFLRNYGPVQVRRYSYSDVKKMTNSFKEKLGQGGYGGVYKGILHDNSLVAVKVLNDSKGNGEEFINEVASISRTSHVNIVSLLGFCFEGRKRALIYQFMPNGSLEKFIFNSNHSLAWDTLFQISLGIARGLEYLHRGCNTRILHFDIKPHNILLDEHLSPKISDFGLARVCTRRESIISMLDARGTIGYIAPEVFCRGFGGVSHKSDVYSYGMLVLEMVGGRKNVNVGVDDTSEIYFPHWIYKRLELDEELGLKRIMNEVEKIEVKKMIIVGLWCTQIDSSNRPAMSRVIEMLEGSLDSLQLPPKPILSSPSYSNFPPDSSSMIV